MIWCCDKFKRIKNDVFVNVKIRYNFLLSHEKMLTIPLSAFSHQSIKICFFFYSIINHTKKNITITRNNNSYLTSLKIQCLNKNGKNYQAENTKGEKKGEIIIIIIIMIIIIVIVIVIVPF